MALLIIYEDNNIIIVNKPAGILVYPDKYTKTKTLVDELITYYPKIKNVGEANRPGIVHRLDRDTSGLLICAKNQDTYEFLVAQFKARQIYKKYFALVFGKVKEKKGVITYSITKKGRKEKEPALTYYKVVKYFTPRKAGGSFGRLRRPQDDSGEFTLLDVKIKTGIMHQIRQHLKMLGHPIVGDKEYFFKNLKPPFPLDHLFLHAYYLKLQLPNDVIKEFEIELPEELNKYLKILSTKF
ncbi:MAG: RluA family pseudouridine synthase [Patescibacteria group bacterium]